MALPLSQLPKEMMREVRARKWLAFLVFAMVSFAVLAAGFLWPYKYSSQVIIFVDDSNIIRPLMEGSAVTTEISERASVAREMLWSRSLMERVATDESIFGPGASDLTPEQLEGRISAIRSNMSVGTRGESYFSIGYQASSPEVAFRAAQRLGQLFIEVSSSRKREESRSAYDFIDKQVKSYERQLAEVEGRLKRFLSENVDGTEGEANSRMASLRGQLELAQMERAELESRVESLRQQLNGVAQTLQGAAGEDTYAVRIRDMEQQLDKLRLQYHDSYPDIVILREQIAELRRQRQAVLADPNQSLPTVGGDSQINPLFQELKGAMVTAQADMETVETRIRSLQRLIAQQEERMERIQENKAQYSDLTRDMEVNKQIYDDLLKRREKARVSMHLDVEGQGLNYRINEAAQYPLAPSGAKFSMFAMAGLFLGLVAPFGAVAGLLQVDPRVRAREQLEEELNMSVLVELPPVRTPFEKRRDRRVTMGVIFCVVIASAIYIAVAVAGVMGVI